MTTLARFETETGIELLIDTVTGESFASISGYARMAGVTQSAISKRISRNQGYDKNEVKTAEIQTEGGLQAVALINEDLISDWIIQDNPAIAKQLLKAGVRVFMHKLAGFTVTSTAVQPQPKHLLTKTDKATIDLLKMRAYFDLGLELEDYVWTEMYQERLQCLQIINLTNEMLLWEIKVYLHIKEEYPKRLAAAKVEHEQEKLAEEREKQFEERQKRFKEERYQKRLAAKAQAKQLTTK